MKGKLKRLAEMTPEERELLRWNETKNRTLSRISFGRLKTFRDYLLEIGYSAGEIDYVYNTQQLDEPITRPQVQELLGNLKLAIEQRHWAIEYDKEHPSISSGETTSTTTEETKPTAIPEIQQEEKEDKYKRIRESIKKFKKQVLEPRGTLLFKQQEEAAIGIIYKIIEKGKWGVLLQAAVGTGKTYVLGFVIAYFEWLGYFKDKTIAPWPIVYITKASIVEQTRRVLAEKFGLDTINGVRVVNVDQLRATFGEMFIKWETRVTDGEAWVFPVWKPNMHPVLFVIDESQMAKNDSSTQSKIIQAISHISYGRPVYVICSSATPFLTVAESKYFVLNCRMNYSNE